MNKCVFCDKPTSFKYEIEGDYYGKHVCPQCQADHLGIKFTGCADKDNCSVKIDLSNKKN